MRDAFAAWADGIPAVLLVHEPFASLAKAQCQALGAREPAILVYQQDQPARESGEQVAGKVREVVAKVVRLLTL